VNKTNYTESILRNAVRIPVRNPTQKSNHDRVVKNIHVVNDETTANCAVARKEPALNNKVAKKNKTKRNVRTLPTRTTKGITAKPANKVTKIKKSTIKVLKSKLKQNVNENRRGKVQETLAQYLDRQNAPSKLEQNKKLICKRSKESVNKIALKPTRASIRKVTNQEVFHNASEDSSYVDSEEHLSENEGNLKTTGENIDDIVNKTVVLQFLPNGDIREDGQNIEGNTNVTCNNEDNVDDKQTTDSVSIITLPRDTNEPIDKAKRNRQRRMRRCVNNYSRKESIDIKTVKTLLKTGELKYITPR
jgi:hypothetical protein